MVALSAPTLPFEAGATIAQRWKVQRRIASGGIADVWAGVEIKTKHPVAIKRLLLGASRQPALVRRFERETDLLGRIHNQFVVRRIDVINDPRYGRVLVEDFIEGESLANALARGTLSVEETREIGFNLLRALGALERANIVHLDLKPANIIMRPVGGGRRWPILVDFGAARSTRASENVEEEAEGVGTLEYIAPEQLSKGRIGVTADLYACATILYRALAGQLPFGDSEELELVKRKLTQEAPRLETGRRDWTAKQLEEVITRGLRRDPRMRFQHADEMLSALIALPPLNSQNAA
jgi:serine/threonine-protein kinase